MAKKASPFTKNEKAKESTPGISHGELNPKPEVAPANENKKDGGSEENDGMTVENKESLVTAPKISEPAFAVTPVDEMSLGGRDMAVVAPRK